MSTSLGKKLSRTMCLKHARHEIKRHVPIMLVKWAIATFLLTFLLSAIFIFAGMDLNEPAEKVAVEVKEKIQQTVKPGVK